MARTGWLNRAAAVLLVLTGMLAVDSSFGQTPTADQIEMFRNLTPEQQQTILQGLGGQNSGTGVSGAINSRGTDSSAGRSDRSRQGDFRRRTGAGTTAEELERQDNILRADDTLLIEIALPRRKFVPAEDPRTGVPLSQSVLPQTLPQSPAAAPAAAVQPLGEWVDPPTFTPEVQSRLEALIALVRSRNPYRLDATGVLTLPGFSGIALGGLSELQANKRLTADPSLVDLDIKVFKLPLLKTGPQSLRRYGYDLFEDSPSTFSPANDVPVPADYVMGAGDELNIQLFGNQNRTFRLPVRSDGTISFPELGPVNVSGQTFRSVKSDVEARVRREMIGVNANVTMGEVRSISVFVLGEARQPGSFTVSGLSTITSALSASGGIKPIGSLRDIQLKRQGNIVRRLDLYDLLMRGDTSNDAKLLPGDAIFIPPIGDSVTIEGEVKRPAIYELRGESRVSDLVAMAGGLTSEADSSRASLTSIDPQSRRNVDEINIGTSSGQGRSLRNGDVLRVVRLRPTVDSGVVLQGAVFRPGPYAWRTGLRLTDIIGSVDELRANADQGYVLIRRELPPNRRVTVLSTDLAAALAAPGSAADVPLMARDQITVFDLEPGRERVIKPVMDELRLQSGLERPTEIVSVSGRVKVPGEYPLESGMRVSDLLRAGGNLDSSAFGEKAELVRYSTASGEARQTGLVEVDLGAIRRGDAAANLLLQPFDHLLVKETPEWATQETVTLRGEVRFPGTYPIRRGETLREILTRAGGLTAFAFPKGSAFTRQDVREREKQQLQILSERMQRDLAIMSLQAAAANQSGASQALEVGQNLLTQMKDSRAIGRMIIDLPALMAGNGPDITLKGGDELSVPRQRQEVTVIGEVQSVTSHLYRDKLSRDEYIALSGGTTRRADKGKIYVVRTDGSVVQSERSLFRRSYDVAILPGDTIVVPLDTERMPRLPFWQAVTQIVYNLAVSAAAVASFQ